MPTHIMVDLETLGVSTRSVILTIGAVKFDPMGVGITSQHYQRVNADSCKAVGMEIDAATIEWWRKQSPEAQAEAFFGENRADIRQVLSNFSVWAGSFDAIWSHGATFDIPLLAEAYAKIGQRTPWKYTIARDTRTLFDLAQVNIQKAGVAHNALQDAANQAAAVQAAYKKLFQQAGGSVTPAPGSICARY